MECSAWKSSLLLLVCCILIIHTFTVLAQDESENFFTEEKLIPLKKTQRYSLYDVYNNDKTFLNYANDISMMDVDINSRHRRQSEGSGSGDRIDECADQNLNNCTGDHVQCIDLYEGFECGCDSPYEWNSEKEACFLNECADESLNDCTGDHVKCIDLDEGFKCGCDEPYEWNAKEKACFWKLYPYGTNAQATLLSKQDDIAERLVVSSGIPFYDRKHRIIYIGSNGVVSFGMYYNPFIMEFPPRYRSVLCPYCADVDTSVSTSGFISYGLYDKNRDNEQVTTILKRANDDIKEYTNEGTFDASQVLIVTWYKVPKYYSEHPDSETVTFQTVIITDGETSYALFIYNELKWKSSFDRIIIGYGENWNTRTISASGTRGAYFRRNIGGIRGQTGFYVFRVGYVQSFSQKCMNWYQSQWNEYNDNMWKYYDLPECPCSVRRLRFDRRWRSIWGRSWGHQCTTLNYNFDFLPKGKSCCYYNGRFISSGVYAGYSYRYHQWYDWISHILSDIRGKYYCCTRSNLCHLFYSIRPTGMCSSTSLFLQGGGYGDPHIATLDGRTFIFNGHGEYTLISIADGQMKMDLQARTGRADTANGTLTSATIFTAFAAKENNKSKFHVELSPDKTKMYVFGNDEDGTFKDYTKLFEDNDPNNTNSFITDKTLSSLTITKGENDELIVLFPSGNSFTIKKGPKLLTIDASIHTKFKEKTSGLLGNFDGNKDNDFIFPSGTTLSNNASEEDIFHYGQTWMITPETSVMMYPRRENANDYNFRNFTPMFLDQADPELKKKAIEICGGVEKIACVFDYVATGSSDIAKATDDKTIETDESQAELANSIPVINNSSTRSLDITKSADAVQFQVSGTDADNDVLVYEFTGKTPEGVTLVLNNATGAGSITATSMDSMSLSFVVKDAKGVYSSVHQIVARVCDGCNEHGTCIFSESRSSVDTVETNDAFIVASCNCTRGWTGDNCSVDYDACEDKPCITGQNCTDLTPEQEVALDRGYNCTACPTGFEEKDGKCADVDECNGTTHGCAQLCENSPGSYSCLCNVGYRQDEKLCHDIDECELGTHGCDQTCINNNGSYSCSCNYGFELNTDNKTCNQTVSDCNVKTNGKNCSYGCQVNSDNTTYICSCKSGYTLNSDGFSCDNINECERNICTQKCNDTIGSYVCSCFDGFKLAADKRSCEACTDLSYGPECDLTCDCGDRASECHSVLGCKCNDGWRGTKCDENVDECEEDQNICGDNMLCKDTVGSFMCICLEGYEKNGTSCVDINECDTEANNCKQECTNVVGSFSCSCRSGFQGDNCTDVDECEADQHDCQQICSNVQGSYNCECQFGYRLKEDRKSCEKVKDVCTLFPDLHCAHGCSVDEQNQAYCFCNTGFRLASDDETCLDINECTTTDTSLRHKCNHTCINKEAGYDCSCPTGYKLENDLLTCKACDSSHWGDNCVNTCACDIGASSCNSETGCVCKTGWRGIHCNEDINECNGGITCPTNSVCDNTPGSYRCKCNDGYRMSSNSITCDNIDECTEKLHNCDQICTDNPGSFVCSCKSGFVWTESTKECKDIDECSTQTYECEHNCINTIGGYDCSCRSGFRLNITNRKECLVETACQNLADCDEKNGGCQNTGTEELCFCNKGFTLNADNKTCDDIKECDANPSPCRAHGKCNEMEGSYNCTCEDGYKLQSDKVSCRECDEGSYGTECAQICSCVAANTESCNKTNGVCTCKTGWNGTNCEEDINECSAANPPECGNNGHCRNVDGSYFCDCDAGFFLLKTACKACDEKHWGLNCAKTCNCTVHAISCNASDGNCACKTGWEGTSCETDIDECSVNTTICSGIANTDCHNKDGSFSCDCKAGYKKKTDGTCEDVDECLESTDNCSVEHKICNNNVGGFTCGACAAGYESSSGDNCTACDETHWGLNCTNNCTCTDHAESCSGTDGTCTCKTGWEGTNCETDIDECSVNTTICSGIANTDCHNMNGSYSCECQSDYPKHSDGTCKACDGKHWGQDCANNCTCTDNASNCSATDGNCTCKTGWEGTNCETDIDECSVNTTICSGIANTDCHNMNGSYSCDCQSDYPKHSDGTCKACDDKHWGQDCAKNCTCTDNASNCSATDGNCICKTGWEGTNCETDIDECSVNTTICSGIANTDCHNMDGSYSCDCQSGYTRNTDGACKDINECLTVSHGCEQQCLNTVGGYKCYCSAGYIISPKDDKQCDETKTYKAVIILEYNLSNASTFEFKQDVAKIKDGLSVYFKSKIDGFIEVIINKITKGSAVVDYTIMINSVLEKNSAGSFTQAVLELAKTGNITIGTSVNILRQQINNKDLTSDTTPCSLLEFIDPCSSGQECEVVEGVAKCNIIQTEDNLPMIIGLSVGIPLFFIILAAIVLVVYLCLRSKRRSDDSFSDDDDIYHNEAFRSVFASSLPRRSHYGPSNLAYQMDSDRFKSFNKDGVRLPRFKTEQMNLNTTVQRDQPEDHRDETPRGEYSWDLLKNVLPSEPLEIKRPKISLFSNPVSPSFKQSTQINEDLS